jgi:UDP-glucuronate 4-epimerase
MLCYRGAVDPVPSCSDGCAKLGRVRSLVTGGAGFIGSHLTEELRARGDDVVAVDSFTDYYDPARKRENARGLDVLEHDLETADLDLLIGSVDRVFHLAGQPGVRKSFGPTFQLYVRRNVLVTARVFEAAARHGIRVVYASSSSVYGDAEAYPTPEDAQPRPISPYGVTKRCCEDLAYAYASTAGLDAVGLRYFTVYGPRQRPDMAFTRMLEALASGDAFPLYGDGSASRSFTYIDDAVSGTIAAMEQGKTGVIYNIGGGEEAAMTEVFALAERISGRALRIERMDAAAGDVRRTRADGTRAAAHLGWMPSTPLDRGLAEHWRWVADRVPVG